MIAMEFARESGGEKASGSGSRRVARGFRIAMTCELRRLLPLTICDFKVAALWVTNLVTNLANS